MSEKEKQIEFADWLNSHGVIPLYNEERGCEWVYKKTTYNSFEIFNVYQKEINPLINTDINTKV